jgi:3-deoxy-D-manno-octulosonic-acid transferase
MTNTLPLALYGAAMGLLEPFTPLVLRRRAEQGKEDAVRLGERLGRPSLSRPSGPLVWLHGVSVGETTSLLPLILALRARRPGLALLVTSGTVTSAELLARRLPGGVLHQFAPVDTPAAVRRFLDHWRPHLAIFVESELWPNLIRAARARGVRLALVSARMTDASANGWSRWPTSARALLSAFDAVLPQDEATAARLTRLGAAVGPRLNLKLVGDPLPCDEAELGRLRAAVGRRKVVVAASTHPGEDALIAGAVEGALTIVVPRHPGRGPEIAAALAAPRRSAGQLPTDAAAYVADTLGELGLFFRLADIVVMGGSFVPGVGGHNPLEPARLGRPIVTGPRAFNAAEVYAEMIAAGAALEASDTAALRTQLSGLLGDAAARRRMGAAARVYAERQGQALAEALDLLEPLLPA